MELEAVEAGRARAPAGTGRAAAALPRWRHYALLLALTALYFGAGRLGLSFAYVSASASAIWPPTGIALGALLVLGPTAWPAIFAGAFLVNVTTSGAVAVSLAIAAGNTLEALAGWWLVSRHAGGARCFERAEDIFRFAVLAALLATTVSATMGAAALYAGGSAAGGELPAIWLTWWLGDATGALLVAPLIVLWHRSLGGRLSWTQRAEAAAMFAAVIGVTALVFLAPGLSGYPLAFLCLPVLAWAAFRFGPREVVTAIMLLAPIATWATLAGYGPFTLGSPHESLLALQVFMGVTALTMLPIAALVRQHKDAVTAAQAANRAKDQFLAMLSHELRNPLQAISSAALLLRQPQRDAATVELAAGVIARQAEQQTRLVNDLLDVSRMIAGKAALVREPVDLGAALQRCVATLATAGRQRPVEVSVAAAWVHADRARLEQVLTNLLVNALKFTPPDGTVRAAVRASGNDAVVEVEDTGAGIDGDLLPRIFDPFTQGDAHAGRAAAGLGLGLTLVRHLVELHGGSVHASSPGPGQGSRFVVRLPRCEPPAVAVPAEATPPAAAPGCRVLLVEDNADARTTLCSLLQAFGCVVREAADGGAGVEEAQRFRPDVALVDIGLPGMDGYAVARTLRALRPDLRLIAITGYGTEQDRQRALAAGFDEHLVKPVDLDDLQRAMRLRAAN